MPGQFTTTSWDGRSLSLASWTWPNDLKGDFQRFKDQFDVVICPANHDDVGLLDPSQCLGVEWGAFRHPLFLDRGPQPVRPESRLVHCHSSLSCF